MKKSLPFFFSVLIVMPSCKNKESDQQTYEQNKKSLAENEKNNIVLFLKIAGSYKRNIIGQTILKGIITNKATVYSYKDVRIKMLCYREDKLMEEHEDIIHTVIKPGNSKEFETKYRLPKTIDSLDLSVMNATPVNAN